MKKYIDNWKKYLFKEEKENYIIFCDMDGTICNFIDPILIRMNDVLNNIDNIQDKELLSLAQQTLKVIGNREVVLDDIKKKEPKVIHDFLFKTIEDDVDFWANLEWLPDGQDLWKYVYQFECYILSAPARGKKAMQSSIEGKKKWIQKNLNISLDKCFFESEKWKYAKPNAILIDDYDKNTKAWESHGGIAILHTSAKDTIDKINKLLRS